MMGTGLSIGHLVDLCFVTGCRSVIWSGQEVHGRENDEEERGMDVWSFVLVACYLCVHHFPLFSLYLHLWTSDPSPAFEEMVRMTTMNWKRRMMMQNGVEE